MTYRHLLSLGALLLLVGCGSADVTQGELGVGAFQLEGNYQSVETVTAICQTGGSFVVPKLTVSFKDNGVCRQAGCSDVIGCGAVDSGMSVEDRLAIIGRDCVLEENGDLIRCPDVTLRKMSAAS